ncbi:Cytochrome c oxidase subunit 2 [Candidatus Hodgkinia cicadicola]|nr:Cytochrome c oxidase subunit 2 [Candidatus Hodgkinia cicadicola]
MHCSIGNRAVSVYISSPRNWQISLQKSASPVMAHTVRLARLTNVLLIPIAVVFPTAIITLCIKYNESTLTKQSHINKSIVLEWLWATIPAAMLVCICSPSLKLLKRQLIQKKKPYATIKVVAFQWYWNYEYSFKRNKFKYDSNIIRDNRRQSLCKTNLKFYPRLLAVDYELVIPVMRVVKVLITSADVIHAFAVPSLGVKIDAIPGKINETWLKATRTGIYYGQCSEFCGRDHSYMPIAIRAIDETSFRNWAQEANTNLENAFSTLTANAKAHHNLKPAPTKWMRSII